MMLSVSQILAERLTELLYDEGKKTPISYSAEIELYETYILSEINA